ncbi:unnamed protein product [Cylicocyclus nassatus]|uniref:SCP domain-containing protein n=1 Tax=Cylicocyclus nassatus TaxID=53992 RepID=A0AA36GED7_CYLNA|nr:unnamed protein product [Cylicocyclus nassatus]
MLASILLGVLCFGLHQVARADYSCSGTALTPGERILMVELHNMRRREVASGIVNNGISGTKLLQARNMKKMDYDCALETDAQNVADSCTLTQTPEAKRPTYGENIAVIEPNGATYTNGQLLANAADQWFTEILRNGMNKETHFIPYFRDKPLSPLRWSQMVWAKSNKIGCGIKNCFGLFYFVVCRYSPKGNVLDDHVYTTGTPCTQCESGCSSDGILCN